MTLAMLIASIMSEVLAGVPQVPALAKTILSSITAALSALVKSGVTASPVTVTSILAALQGVVVSLQGVSGLPQSTLSLIADLDTAVQAAVAADKIAQQGVDPTQLQPVQPLPDPQAVVHPAQ